MVALDETTPFHTVLWAGGTQSVALGDFQGGFEVDTSLDAHLALLDLMNQAAMGLDCPAEWNPRSHYLAMEWNCCLGAPDPEATIFCGTTT